MSTYQLRQRLCYSVCRLQYKRLWMEMCDQFRAKQRGLPQNRLYYHNWAWRRRHHHISRLYYHK